MMMMKSSINLELKKYLKNILSLQVLQFTLFVRSLKVRFFQASLKTTHCLAPFEIQTKFSQFRPMYKE